MPSLLERTRSLNVIALTEAIAAAAPAHVEPALRRADGELATTGEWQLPMRVDFLRKGRESEQSEPVTPTSKLSFSVFAVNIDRVQVEVGPFGWDWVEVATDQPPQTIGPSLKAWFLEWFDSEDTNSADGNGLYGVVHFASDPAPTPGGSAFAVDLGSAPIACFFSLFSHLSVAGVGAARVG